MSQVLDRACSVCAETKPLDAFGRNERGPLGRLVRCRDCANAANRARRAADPDIHAKEKAYRDANRERLNARRREYSKTPQFRERRNARQRALNATPESRAKRSAWSRRNKYGLAVEDFDRLVLTQEGRCALCERPGDLVVDHCHREGHVRALLCDWCNRALGLFRDNADVLARAAEYVKPKAH